MTLTPWDFALASIAAPEPESRLTSRITFAPLVIACSACCCWVDLSPWAFWIVTGTPADLNACWSNGRSAVSQRTDDFVSGSSTATLAGELLLLLLPLLLLPPAPPPLLPPQAAMTNERAHTAGARASTRREIGERITCSSSVEWTCVGWELSGGGPPLAGRARVSRAPRRARAGLPPLSGRPRPPPGSRSAAPPRASGRAGGRRRPTGRRRRSRGPG